MSSLFLSFPVRILVTLLFLKASFLPNKFSKVEKFCSAHFTSSVNRNIYQIWSRKRKNPFNTNSAGDLPNSKGFRRTSATDLNYITLINLNPLFRALNNFITDRYIISGFYFRKLSAFCHLLLNIFNCIHCLQVKIFK